MRGFSTECKFKRTGDLFIWAIIRLRVPPWVTAAHTDRETPFAVASRVHTDRTNALVQPLIKNDVCALLEQLAPTPLELFCVYGALAMELVPTAVQLVLTNSQLFTADPGKPTLAVVTRFEVADVSHACGYMLEGTFHFTEDPLQAVVAWAVASDPEGPMAQYACHAGSDPILGNPLTKFVR
jgi:hypothetical protein